MKVFNRACSLVIVAAMLSVVPLNSLAAGKFKISVKLDMDKFTKFTTAYSETDAEAQLRELVVTDTKDYYLRSGSTTLVYKDEYNNILGIGDGTAKCDASRTYYMDISIHREDLSKDVPDISDVEFVLNGSIVEPARESLVEGEYLVVLPIGQPKKQAPVKEVNITVEGGTADVSKTTIGGLVRIKATPTTPEKEFEKWEVVEGEVSWDSEDRPYGQETFFTVVSGDVKIRATYKQKTDLKKVDLNIPLDSIEGFKVGLSETEAQASLKKIASEFKNDLLTCSGDTTFLCYEKDGKYTNVSADGIISGKKHYLADLSFSYDGEKYNINDNTKFYNNGKEMKIFAKYYFPSSFELIVELKPEPVVEPEETTPTPTPTATATPAPADSNSMIRDFVERIYINVLDRAPEADGSEFWYNELYAFRRSGAEVAQGFIFSPEFESRKTDNRTFVTILYKTFFGREADDAGLNYWLEQLSSGAKDRATVANDFIYSQEWADTCARYGIRSGGTTVPSVEIVPTDATYAFVERMYTTALGRSFDKDGREYWAKELANFKITGEQVGASFFLSDEMTGYGLSDKDFLSRLYATFMNREPDADGSAYWLGVLGSGTQRADVVFGFTRSPEFTDKCVEARILPY